jgi:hypothetical protein
MKNETNWSALLNESEDGKMVMQQFAQGNLTAREVVNHFKFTDAAGTFRRLERTHGTAKARLLTRKALKRRGLLN